MAPKNKREKVPEGEEVCKRLKDDIKVAASGDAKTLETTKEDPTSKNNNNNNSTEDDKTKNGSSNKSVDNKSEVLDVAANGAKTMEPPSTTTTKTSTSDGKLEVDGQEGDKKQTSEINGDSKKEEPVASAETKQETSTAKNDQEVKEDEMIGTLLICGGANWEMTGRKELPKSAKKPVEVDPAARNLWGPVRVVLEKGGDKSIRVRGVFSGCNACHSVIVTDDGLVMTFGRNDKGQLGLGDTETRTCPTVVEAFKGIDIVAAACGRSHTLFLDSNGIVYACGDNKMGQCGTNQMAVQQISTPARIAFKENKKVTKISCGAEFSMIIDADGKLYSFGHPEHGQLGHNSEGKYFTTGNKYAFHCEYQPRRIVTFIEKSREGHVTPVDDVSIIDVACGTNHTLAVDSKNRCYSWGFAGYHRLGHCETKNELVPRSIKVFDSPNNTGRGAAKVFAGASHSMALDVNGLLYFWGQNKSSGEATMYPKNVQDLCGWRIKAVACANRSIFVIADDTCISWGPSPTYGELGYGEGKSKSSTIPQEVKTLEGISAKTVSCGFGHTLMIARDTSKEDQSALNKLKSWPY